MEMRRQARLTAKFRDQKVLLAEAREARLPADYKKRIEARFVEILKDPDSRRVEYGGNPHGSVSCGTINAKNSYGGYTGRQPYVAYFTRSGEIAMLESFSDRDIVNVRQFSEPGDLYHVQFELLKACRNI